MPQTLIQTIPMLPFGMLNAFLVVQDQRAILIDTGLPGSAPRVEAALRVHGLDWSAIALIVLTHAHIDHAGSAVELRSLSDAPIIAHEAEIPYCQGEPPVLRPTDTFARLFRLTGAIERPFPRFEPDRVMTGDRLDLAPDGFAARLLHTPGHTPGSLSILLETGSVFAGDLVASGVLLGGIIRKGRPKPPPFEEDSRAVKTSLRRLLVEGMETFYLGHGGPLPRETVRRFVAQE
ncbi:MBL fold metallo-hydrolase [Arenibacterium sp. LLYu02]|uniref:MBL fold metallo-hydrolase n=1 Tax=Arenibacterium sp. LLYu02 TaxID=3404132 RepID=UPI003B20EBE6